MAAMAEASPLVSAAWLKENLHRPDVRVLDATWFMPNMGTLLSFLSVFVCCVETVHLCAL